MTTSSATRRYDPTIERVLRLSKSRVELRRLDWDTAFFGAQMGSLVLTPPTDAAESARRAHALEDELRRVLARADDEGYAHLIFRVPAGDLSAARAAERAGLTLVDVGIDSSISFPAAPPPERPDLPIRAVRAEDVPDLCELAADSFLLSRFTADPFFSTEQVRAFHREWVKNLCAGLAQMTLVCDLDGALAGFVSCATSGDEGRISLIAIRSGDRRRGLGRALVSAALRWFGEAGTRVARVKTQAHNYPALALYHRSGFLVSNAELTFSIALPEAGLRQGD